MTSVPPDCQVAEEEARERGSVCFCSGCTAPQRAEPGRFLVRGM